MHGVRHALYAPQRRLCPGLQVRRPAQGEAGIAVWGTFKGVEGGGTPQQRPCERERLLSGRSQARLLTGESIGDLHGEADHGDVSEYFSGTPQTQAEPRQQVPRHEAAWWPS